MALGGKANPSANGAAATARLEIKIGKQPEGPTPPAAFLIPTTMKPLKNYTCRYLFIGIAATLVSAGVAVAAICQTCQGSRHFINALLTNGAKKPGSAVTPLARKA